MQPATSAGAILHAICSSGKFHGVIAPTTPSGSFTTVMRPLCCSQATRSACAPIVWNARAGDATWIVRVRCSGMPSSPVISSESSSPRAARSTPTRSSSPTRAASDIPDHSASAARAATTARSTSMSDPAPTLPMTAPLAELMTAMSPAPVESTHSPPM